MAATTHGRAALQRELERAIRHVLELSRSRKRLTGKAVHEMRKALKRVRAALRLVRDAVGKDEYARENALLRDAGRALRAVRDAEVVLSVVADLAHGKAARALALPALPRQPAAKRLSKKIRRMRGKLQHKALKRAAKLYKRKPKAFVRRVAP